MSKTLPVLAAASPRRAVYQSSRKPGQRIVMASALDVAWAHGLDALGVEWAYRASTTLARTADFCPTFYLWVTGQFIEVVPDQTDLALRMRMAERLSHELTGEYMGKHDGREGPNHEFTMWVAFGDARGRLSGSHTGAMQLLECPVCGARSLIDDGGPWGCMRCLAWSDVMDVEVPLLPAPPEP